MNARTEFLNWVLDENRPAQIDGWLVDENGAGCIGDMDRAIHIDGDSLVVETVGARIPLTVVRAVLDWPKAHDLTPSEVVLAKFLAAWEEWPGWEGNGDDIDEIANAVAHIGDVLAGCGLVTTMELDRTEKSRALLDRARKAGVL